MNIPKKIKIGGITYTVNIVEAIDVDKDTAGRIDTVKANMKVLKGNSGFMLQTFLHEIFHAINMEFEETTIEFLSQSMTQIIVDNPKIFQKEVTQNKNGKTKKSRK